MVRIWVLGVPFGTHNSLVIFGFETFDPNPQEGSDQESGFKNCVHSQIMGLIEHGIYINRYVCLYQLISM